jgi:hypothetical protein
MEAVCKVDTWELNGKDQSGATIGGGRERVAVESNSLHTNRVRIRIGDAHAVVDANDMIRAIEAAKR